MRNGRKKYQSEMLSLDKVFVARSSQDLRQQFKNYINDEELMSKKTFLDHLGMKHKEDLPQYKGTFLKKRQWELSSSRFFYQFKCTERYIRENDNQSIVSVKAIKNIRKT